jgi:hypothetical protein
MKKKSASQLAFFNLRVLIGLVVVLAGVFLALLGFGTFSNLLAQANGANQAQGQQPTQEQIGRTTVFSALRSDLSRPLREQPLEWPPREKLGEEHEASLNPKIPHQHVDGPDPVIQDRIWSSLVNTPSIPGPVLTWAGIPFPGVVCNCAPPDTNGDVGKTQYVQDVNEGIQVFNKTTGASLFGPVAIRSLWAGFGGVCETAGSGDPVVVYDSLADRWVVSQFAVPSGAPVPQDECIAVSQSGDATGAYYRYQFHLTGNFLDYPHFGVWPDGYYMSANIFNSSGTAFLGPQAFVFDRAKMLVGDPTATLQTRGITGGATEETFLPADLDGLTPPPAGAANPFVEWPSGNPLVYKIYKFHADFVNPANSTFTLFASPSAAAFTMLCPATRNCVPQLGATAADRLDAIADRLMFRSVYRNINGGTLVNNYTVSANAVAGIRWFELRNVNTGPVRAPFQQRTYQPDTTWRWMGSVAMDNQGNLALGFSASSSTINPQLRYAGRLATDPLNVLAQGEAHLFDGTGSQTGTVSRWGDYSDLTIDPVDDCTFYYTNEYYDTTSQFNWRTRIGYFKFTQCTPPSRGTAHFAVTACNGGAPLGNASVSIDGTRYGATIANGTYDATLAPGSHTYSISKPTQFGTVSGSFSITNGQTTDVNACLNFASDCVPPTTDFNNDGKPDYVLYNGGTRQTAVWHMHNNVFAGSAYGPTLPTGWNVIDVADFNGDGNLDYALFHLSTRRTAIWYLSGAAFVSSAYGPTLPSGWTLIATADFNGDCEPDYVLYNASTRQTVVWHMNNNVFAGGVFGPTLPAGWRLAGVADLNADGRADYLLFNPSTRQSAIWYLSGVTFVGGAFGPTIASGYELTGTADFNGDGKPDYLLYNPSTRQTAIWYLNNITFIGGAVGPILPAGWNLVAP